MPEDIFRLLDALLVGQPAFPSTDYYVGLPSAVSTHASI